MSETEQIKKLEIAVTTCLIAMELRDSKKGAIDSLGARNRIWIKAKMVGREALERNSQEVS